jgi:hypothetical protein
MKGGEDSSSAVGGDATAGGAGLDGEGDPRVQMELSAVSGESGMLSGAASLLGEGEREWFFVDYVFQGFCLQGGVGVQCLAC